MEKTGDYELCFNNYFSVMEEKKVVLSRYLYTTILMLLIILMMLMTLIMLMTMTVTQLCTLLIMMTKGIMMTKIKNTQKVVWELDVIGDEEKFDTNDEIQLAVNQTLAEYLAEAQEVSFRLQKSSS